jgi:hypothetical protein
MSGEEVDAVRNDGVKNLTECHTIRVSIFIFRGLALVVVVVVKVASSNRC